MCIAFNLYMQTSADVPRTAVTHLPRSRPRSVAARRLVMMRRKRSRSRLRLLPLRRLGRAKPRSKPTTKKMLRPSKPPRERDEPRRSSRSRSRRLMRKLPSKLRLPRRRAGPRRPNRSLKPKMRPPLSSPRREAVPRKPRSSPRSTRKRLMSQSQSPSPSPLPRRAAERRRLLPTVMTIRPRLPRPLLQSGADPRRGKHELCPSGEHTF